jgi:flagellar motor protein MotB
MELSIRAYAKHRGVTEAAVRKAITQGRISKSKNGKINPEKADKEWNKNTDPAQIKRLIPEEKPDYSQNSSPNAGPSYQQSRAIKEAYGAKLLRLQFEKESKKLISVDDVKVSAFNAARMTRDRILGIVNLA